MKPKWIIDLLGSDLIKNFFFSYELSNLYHQKIGKVYKIKIDKFVNLNEDDKKQIGNQVFRFTVNKNSSIIIYFSKKGSEHQTVHLIMEAHK